MASSLSPALSFSLDPSATIDHSSLSSSSSSSSPISSSSHDDFSFNVIPLDNISFPADQLFSHGGLLPLNEELTIARSTSVNVSTQASPRPFPRSKSTGSYMTQSRNRNRNLGEYDQKKRSRNAKDCYYYSGSEGRINGVRISPVINVRMRFIPRGGSGSSSGSGSANKHTSEGSKYKYIRNSFFSYLLCNCREKNGKELVCGVEI